MATSISEEFPLHSAVWDNDTTALNDKLALTCESELEKLDPRGRTPLMLAVALNRFECVSQLLSRGANANAESKKYWAASHEAVASGDPEIVQLVIQYRDYQRYKRRLHSISTLLDKLKDAPDFYVEMKWEFTSWVPLVSRMCPSDTYRVYKRGASVRIDTTLVGFDQTTWQRGNISYIFKSTGTNSAVMEEIDHDRKTIYAESMHLVNPATADGASSGEASQGSPRGLALEFADFKPSPDAVAERLTTPVATTFIDVEKISFERVKSGIWGWRSDKVEDIDGYECKVYSASNVDLVTKTRTEHLTDSDKKQCSEQEQNITTSAPLNSLLKMVQGGAEQSSEEGVPAGQVVPESPSSLTNPSNITKDEYFNLFFDLQGRDVGRPKEVKARVQGFRASLALSEQCPLSLSEQITPIIDLMAPSNAHFARLKNFIELQLPAGFPVKIEIPLYHVLTAKITFGNVFGVTTPVDHVTPLPDSAGGCTNCDILESVFEMPSHYMRLETGSTQASRQQFRHHTAPTDDEELWLQFALQQSLLEDGGDQIDMSPSTEALQLQRAIDESMRVYQGLPTSGDEGDVLTQRGISSRDVIDAPVLSATGLGIGTAPTGYSDEITMALEMSRLDEEDRKQRLEQEEAELNEIIKLSLMEK